ncbi:MAG TPA: GreA/GreB family elongation factor [Chloroflexota bacterium]|nr:GreA/GreB family elongation factor [Chloroflexota bacterium]
MAGASVVADSVGLSGNQNDETDAHSAIRARIVERLRSISQSVEEVPLGRGQRSSALLLNEEMLVIPRVQLRAKPLGGGGSCYWVAFDQNIVSNARARYRRLSAVIACGDQDHVVVLPPDDLERVLGGPPRQRVGSRGALWDPLVECRIRGGAEHWTLRFWNSRRERETISLDSLLNAFELLVERPEGRERVDPRLSQRARLVERIATLEEAVSAARAQWSGDDGDRAYNLSAIDEHATALAQLEVLDAEIAAAERARESARLAPDANNSDASVNVGSDVVLRDEDGAFERYTLVAPGSALAGAGWISTASPLGRALIGQRAGETVAVAAPGGDWRVTIISVTGGAFAHDKARD